MKKFLFTVVFCVWASIAHAQFITDNFTDTATTVITLHTVQETWTLQGGCTNIGVISNTNTARAEGGALSCAAYYGTHTPSDADYYVTNKFVHLTDVASNHPCIGLRMDTAAHRGYWLCYEQGGTKRWEVWKINNTPSTDTYTSLGSSGTVTLTNGQSYTGVLDANGTTIKPYIDGVTFSTTTDSTFSTAGRAGFEVGAADTSDTTGTHIDDFQAFDTNFSLSTLHMLGTVGVGK